MYERVQNERRKERKKKVSVKMKIERRKHPIAR